MVTIINPDNKKPLTREGNVFYDDEGNSFPIVNGVPRFVAGQNYTNSFGFQWNKFEKTQLDRESNSSNFTKKRFFAETEWKGEDLVGQDILEAGSGAGRFTQVVLDYTKANLYSFDYSDAVSANFRNNSHHGERLHLFQADMYKMPFPDNSFDKVFCFGVLQHTPDFRKSIKALVDKARPGGEIVVDFYAIKGWYTKLSAKYMLRPFTKKMSHEKMLNKIERNADRLIGAYRFFDKIGVGKVVNRFLPVCDIKRTLPDTMPKEELRQWVILDTFDMFSPAYDNPQKITTVKKWMEESGATVTFADYLTYANNLQAAVVRAVKN